MSETKALIDTLRNSADQTVVAAIEIGGPRRH